MLTMRDEDFERYLELLNRILGDYHWQHTSARKDHVDAFGKSIEAGDVYFKRECGIGYHQVYKMSKESMVTYLDLLFIGAPQAEAIGERMKERYHERMREIMESLPNIMPPEEKS